MRHKENFAVRTETTGVCAPQFSLAGDDFVRYSFSCDSQNVGNFNGSGNSQSKPPCSNSLDSHLDSLNCNGWGFS